MSNKLILKGLPIGARATKIYNDIAAKGSIAPLKIYVKDFQKMSVAYLEYSHDLCMPSVALSLEGLQYQKDMDSYPFPLRCEIAFDKPHKVFLGNLPFDICLDEIDELSNTIAHTLGLDKYDLKIEPVQWVDGRCKGFGFLMTEEVNAKRLLSLSPRIEVRGRVLIIKPASTKK